MLVHELSVDHVYLACGHTDMRKAIDGLASLVEAHFHLDPHQPALFLFCGRKKDRIKGLLWEGDGFLLLYKVLTGYKYQWPRNASEARMLTRMQYARLLEGLEIEKKVFSPPKEFF